MDDLSKRTALVYDYGLWPDLAERLTRDFGHVLYHCPWKCAYPKLADSVVGQGIPGVQIVPDFWDVVGDVDLFIFPELYDGDLQSFLRKNGKRVWGAGDAEWLEVDRWAARERGGEIGVDWPPSVRIVGLDALREHCEESEDEWIKVSAFRGEFETFHHITAFSTRPFLDDLAAKYGPLANQVELIVERGVEGVEIGYDGYCIDGRFPSLAMFGVEVKDSAYLGEIRPYAKLPKAIKDVNAAFADDLREGKLRSFLSFEIRTSPEATYCIDPCMRCASPSFEAAMELYGNLAQVLWEGAAGNLIDPEPVAKCAALATIFSPWAAQHWTPIEIPKEVDRWVKLHNVSILNGKHHVAPRGQEICEIGVVLGIGDTFDEAILKAEAVAERIEGCQVKVRTEALYEALEEFGKLNELPV